MNDETSESGAPIRRYDAPAERQWTPPDKVREILNPQRPSSLKRPWWRPF